MAMSNEPLGWRMGTQLTVTAVAIWTICHGEGSGSREERSTKHRPQPQPQARLKCLMFDGFDSTRRCVGR